MSAGDSSVQWDARAASAWVAAPHSGDDKYSRGVLTVATGSTRYPGAAVLSVEAVARTGVGMIRYVGASEPTRLVLERRPEVVLGDGRSNAFLAGSGIDADAIDAEQGAVIANAFRSGEPVVLDASLIVRAREVCGACVITPHATELARALGEVGEQVSPEEISSEPERWAATAADRLDATVLLKGARSCISTPASWGERFETVVSVDTHWLASAGTGDVLAGILGALVATHASAVRSDPRNLGALAATAAYIHAQAGAQASAGGPLVALDVAESISRVVAELVGLQA